MKQIIRFLAGVCVLGGAFLYSIWSVGSVQVGETPKDTSSRMQINIKPGSTVASLRDILKIDVSETRFRLYQKWFAPDFSLQSGTYAFTGGMSLESLLQWPLQKPLYNDQTITILPGWSIYDIDPYLASQGIMKAGELIRATPAFYPKLQKKYSFLDNRKSFEGFLYPDTYRVRQGARLDEVLDTLLGTFQSRIYSKLSPKETQGMYKTLILASIVEREERNSQEKATVAGVLARRIEIGMSLWADATICYALKLSSRECTPSRIVEGLESTSAYNTRRYAGLPPTPISNPSRETWLAALQPKYTQYLYYLHDAEGGIHYGETLEEHNINKRKYIY